MALLVDIRKNFGEFQLNVKFETGSETMALLGASGCGKSVTLKCIAGLLKPDEGKIVLDGGHCSTVRQTSICHPRNAKSVICSSNMRCFPT